MQYGSSSETLFFFLNTVYKVLELLTIKAGLLKTMLTVFKHNTKASTFFKEVKQYAAASNTNTQIQMQGLKYSVDETSPLDTIQVSVVAKKQNFVVEIG